MRNLAKLLMNSLYGKFGMNPIQYDIQIVANTELQAFVEANKSFEVLREGAKATLVRRKLNTHNMNPSLALRELLSPTSPKDTIKVEMSSRSNVAIAAAITAYSRIALAQHMNDPNNPVFYHDTDSVIVQHPLPASAVGVELGQMKLEYTIKDGIFAGPKLYSIITEEGKAVIKAKGYGSEGLTHKDFRGLLDGTPLTLMKEY